MLFDIWRLPTLNNITGIHVNRPVLVVHVDAEVFAYTVETITSQFKNKSFQIQKNLYKIKQWKQAGLSKQSYIDVNSDFEYDWRYVKKYGKFLGTLSLTDQTAFVEFVEQHWQN